MPYSLHSSYLQSETYIQEVAGLGSIRGGVGLGWAGLDWGPREMPEAYRLLLAAAVTMPICNKKAVETQKASFLTQTW